MEIGTVLHGFEIVNKRFSEELGGTLYEMRHQKTHAQLVFMDNKADNKLFSVAFKTLPWDDTGVFHILEHSVLAGSESYPVKEPFLDLLKSSMNTFLNAMTFPDKTLYPVSSRNEQDFMNLVGVYLDAVFKPAIYYNESIFRQEGWHYELDEDGNPFYNGVVFNEMKGALSSVNGLTMRTVAHHLYPDTPYGFESGGDPKNIPDLTYEDFLRAHREFYAPSNALIYLDGDVPLDRVLALIDETYFADCGYVAQAHEIAMQQPFEQKDVQEYYEIGAEDSEENKAYIAFAKVFGDWADRKRIMAFSAITTYLADSNESPLKRAMLEKGLAQDMDFFVMDGIAQAHYLMLLHNTEAEKKDAILATFREVIESILNEGIDREEFNGILNRVEYNLREIEEPQGLMRNINALSSWLYGGDPMLYLENNELLASLRSELDGDYFENILREMLDFSGSVTLTMLPSKTKGAEDAAAEKARVNAEYKAFSDDEKQHVADIYEKMRTWQDTPDSPEAKATLPVLALSDVSKTPMWTDTQLLDANGVPLLFHQLHTGGIAHVALYFDISDMDADTLQALSLSSSLLSHLPTREHTAKELQKKINQYIGSLDFDIMALEPGKDSLVAKVYYTVSYSVLEQNLESATALVLEILTQTDFCQKEMIRENLLQEKETLYRSFIRAGQSYGKMRALRQTYAASFADDLTAGYDYLRYMTAFSEGFDSRADAYIALVQSRVQEVFSLSRLTLSETAQSHSSVLNRFAKQLPIGTAAACDFCMEKQPPVKEQILIPSGVSYAVSGINTTQIGQEFDGALTVLSTMLTYGYLWNEIRVHGGAYGCGFRAGISGAATFHSYRDPAPLNSLEVYKNTAQFIREFAAGEEEADKYIISSIASAESLKSPLQMGKTADVYYFTHTTYEDKQRNRTRMLSLKKEDLTDFCALFDKMAEESSVCIVGNEKALADAGEGWTVLRL